MSRLAATLIALLSLIGLRAETSILERCEAVMQKGDFLFSHFGEAVNTDSLLADFAEIDLSSPELKGFLTATRALKFTNYYFMLRDMSRGATFMDSRDGIAITPTYPLKPLNEYDYAKLREIFSTSSIHATIHEAYLKKLPFLFRTYGYPDQLVDVRALIEANTADSKAKTQALETFAAYDHLRQGKSAPAIHIDSSGTNLLDLPELKGKAVVLDVWASWCHSCLNKMPAFKELAAEIESSYPDKIKFIALSVDADPHVWAKAVKRHAIDALPSFRAAKDIDNNFDSIYRVDGVPRYIIIDRNHAIVNAFSTSPGEKMRQTIINILEKTDVHAPASEGGVQWMDYSLQQALDSADAQGKKVFIDCFTKTCGPCRFMVNKIFPLPECGEHMNPRYISIMMDMEEGEGLKVGKTYGVQMYPTYLALNPDGSVHFRLEGGASKTSEAFLKKLTTAEIIAEKNTAYNEGCRDPQFIRDYLTALKAAHGLQAQKVMSDYFMSLPLDSIAKTDNLLLIHKFVSEPSCPIYQHLLVYRHEVQSMMDKNCEDATGRVDKILKSIVEMNFLKRLKMTTDLEAWVPGVEKLETDSVKGASSLKWSLIVRNIINHRLTERVPEITAMLDSLSTASSPDGRNDWDCMISYLAGIERVATPAQRELLATAITSAWPDPAQPELRQSRDMLIDRLRRQALPR